MPFQDFDMSAKVLDYRRLGKQRVECKQILMAINGESKGWIHHPVTKMWIGYEQHLISYAIAICKEWISRGYKDSLLPWFEQRLEGKLYKQFWKADKAFFVEHRVRLWTKDPEFYGKLWNNFGELIL